MVHIIHSGKFYKDFYDRHHLQFLAANTFDYTSHKVSIKYFFDYLIYFMNTTIFISSWFIYDYWISFFFKYKRCMNLNQFIFDVEFCLRSSLKHMYFVFIFKHGKNILSSIKKNISFNFFSHTLFLIILTVIITRTKGTVSVTTYKLQVFFHSIL